MVSSDQTFNSIYRYQILATQSVQFNWKADHMPKYNWKKIVKVARPYYWYPLNFYGHSCPQFFFLETDVGAQYRRQPEPVYNFPVDPCQFLPRKKKSLQ